MEKSKELYQKYTQEVHGQSIRMLRILCFVGALYFPVFGIVDYAFEFNNFTLFVYIRLSVLLSIGIIYLLTFTKFGNKNVSWLGVIAIFIVSASIILMIICAEKYKLSYYEGLVLIIIGYSLFMRWETKYTVYSCLFVYLTYLSASIFIETIWDIRTIFVYNFFLCSVIILSILSSYFTNKIYFNIFKSSHELEESNMKLQKTQVELIEANRNKDIFMANISHELRTPLTLMLLPIKPLMNGKYGALPEMVMDILGMINKNSLKLLKMINDLLDMAKLEDNKMRLNLKKVEAVSFCKGIVDSILPTTEERGLTLNFRHTAEMAEVVIDSEQFEKVLLNLLSNAIKFTPEGGIITLAIDEMDNHVVFTVEDNGEGIPDDMHDIIFDRFSQVDNSATKKHGGTGIGLSLVREIVELHKGTVEVNSEIGRGSRFTVKLLKGDNHITEKMIDRRKADKPVAVKKRLDDYERVKMSDVIEDKRQFQLIDLANVSLPEIAGIDLGSHDSTLLLIDDNHDMLSLISMILREEYNILVASSAEEGLKIMREKKPDLVVSDVMMPGMNGYEFCRQVKLDETLRHTPILLVTALSESDRIVEGVDSGADDYLSKPFEPVVLKARIRSLLRMRSIEAELALTNRNFKVRTEDLIERQQSLFSSLIKSLVSTIDAKDEYTHNHSLRVTEYCLAIAEMMGVAERERKDIELAAILHDVGKIGVPESILLKEGTLTDEEFSYVKTHSIKGEDIIKQVKELANVALIVRAHHERYDGRGYPDGLAKQSIPFGARIMSVADSYDAMTSNRPYRMSLSHNTAVKEIVKNSGTQFDPEVVEHFLKLTDRFNSIRSSNPPIAS
jgi:response regulator RpfG family c-di-GMP phosphodiesterase/signal transduction histidine kinase